MELNVRDYIYVVEAELIRAMVRRPKYERYGPTLPNGEGHKILSKNQI